MPMTREEVYHTDPEILGGTLVVTGTRVPVQEFLDGFPGVNREQAVGFLELAKDALLAA